MILNLMGQINWDIIEYIENFYNNQGLTTKIININDIGENFLKEIFNYESNISEDNVNIVIRKTERLEDDNVFIIKEKHFSVLEVIENFNENNINYVINKVIDEIDVSNEDIKIIINGTPTINKLLKKEFGDELISVLFKENEEILSTVLTDYEIDLSKVNDVTIFTSINKFLNEPRLLIEYKEIKSLTNLKKIVPIEKNELKELSEKKRKYAFLKQKSIKLFDSIISQIVEYKKLTEEELIKYTIFFIEKFLECKKEKLPYKIVLTKCFHFNEENIGILDYLELFKVNKSIEIFLRENNTIIDNLLLETDIEVSFYKLNKMERLAVLIQVLDFIYKIRNNNEIKKSFPKHINLILEIFYNL